MVKWRQVSGIRCQNGEGPRREARALKTWVGRRADTRHL